MYKRFTIEEIKTIKNNFIENMAHLMQREKTLSLKEFLMKSFLQGDEIYFFNRWIPVWRLSQDDEFLTFIDEKEKIELILKKEQQNQLQSLLRAFMTRRTVAKPTMSVKDILEKAFEDWNYNTIWWKPYLVYDIETSANIENLKETEYYMAYFMQPWEWNKMNYSYVGKDKLDKFVKMLLDFDGYIIGFNSIAFDNPVCVYNVGGTDDDIKKINEKSLDLYLFVRNLTWKRMWLNKISTAFVWVEKTLNVADEDLYKKYIETDDVKYLNEFKKYCKNDVKMTTLVLLYFLHFKKMFLEWNEITYSIDDFLENAKLKNKLEKKWDIVEEGMFW